jgi:hypothetical protein
MTAHLMSFGEDAVHLMSFKFGEDAQAVLDSESADGTFLTVLAQLAASLPMILDSR